MAIPRSHHKRQWVWIQFAEGEPWDKAYIRKVTMECSFPTYDVTWENGERELLFVGSVHRIRPVNPKKGKVIDFAKRRKKLLRIAP
jgi:hypothetical protein